MVLGGTWEPKVQCPLRFGLCGGCAPTVRTALEMIGRSRRIALVMDVERTAQHWLIQAAVVLRRVTGAERRFAVSLKVNEVTMLAAADELGAATRDATSWIAANVCPDLELEGRVCPDAGHMRRGSPSRRSGRSSIPWLTRKRS